ncbi:hypothetical protein [Paenibacillus sp. FSL L8-0323]|uniref:hypothetical protein n=1 Tax=unclassified Paenibacillus TaxID=185978 RepID=UPI0030F4CD26
MSYRYDRQHLNGQQKAIAAQRDKTNEELQKQPEKKVCETCGGKGQIYNDEWDRAWDKYDMVYPSHDLVNAKMADSGIPKYVGCPDCSRK